MQSHPPIPADVPSTLLDRARQGDQVAWQILFDECYPKIQRVVRKRLSKPMRKMYDSTDIANEVMKSLAAKFDRFDFSSIDGLSAFLIRAAEQKVVDGHRRGHAKKRDIGRNQALYANSSISWEPADSSPTPSQLAVATEVEEALLGGRSEMELKVLKMKLQGDSNREVAQATGWHLRKVERFLEKLKGACRL